MGQISTKARGVRYARCRDCCGFACGGVVMDVVNKLRKVGWCPQSNIGLCREAADEIEHLRAVNLEIYSVLHRVREACLFDDDDGTIGVS